jgi:hypothetical protein
MQVIIQHPEEPTVANGERAPLTEWAGKRAFEINLKKAILRFA